MFASWRVAVVFTAANLTGGAFRGIVASSTQAEKAVAGNEAALKRMRAVAIGAFATIGVVGVAAFMHAADAAAKYQLEMTLLQQQLGTTDEMMEKIGRRITSLSAGKTVTLFGATDLAVMARNLQQSGLTAAQVEQLLQPVAYAAEVEKARKGGHLDPGHFASSQGATIRGYGLNKPGREKDMLEFEDWYTRVASVSKLDATGLLAYENQAGQYARVAGISYKDFLTMGGFLTQAGIKPMMAGTMFKNLLTNSQPRATLTSHAMNAQFAALTHLGLLDHSDPTIARNYLAFTDAQTRQIGLLPKDSSAMTAKAQEDYAAAAMRSSVTGKLTRGGVEGMLNKFRAARANYDKPFGQTKGDAMFESDMRNAFNLRGAPAGILLALSSATDWSSFMKTITQQQNLDKRAASIRALPATQKMMLPQLLNTLMVQLGGSTPGGKTVPGSPLAIMGAFLTGLTGVLRNLAEWGAENPKLISQIGTLIGVLGIAGLLGALTMVGAAMLPLIASITTAAGSLGIGALVVAIAGPAGIAAAAIGAVAGIVFLVTHIGDVQHYLGKIGKWIHDFGAPALGKAMQDAWNAAVYRITHPTADAASGAAKNKIQGQYWPPAPQTFNWIAPTKGSFLNQLFPGWTEIQSGTWQKNWQAPSGQQTPGNAPGQGPQAMAFQIDFHGITDTKAMVKALEDQVNKWLNFEQNRHGGVAANPRIMPQGGW